MPVDGGSRSFYFIGIAKHSETLGRGRFRGPISILPSEVLLINVDGVVLAHASRDDGPQGLHVRLIIIILLRLLAVALDVGRLRRVHIFRPAALGMAYRRGLRHPRAVLANGWTDQSRG